MKTRFQVTLGLLNQRGQNIMMEEEECVDMRAHGVNLLT